MSFSCRCMLVLISRMFVCRKIMYWSICLLNLVFFVECGVGVWCVVDVYIYILYYSSDIDLIHAEIYAYSTQKQASLIHTPNPKSCSFPETYNPKCYQLLLTVTVIILFCNHYFLIVYCWFSSSRLEVIPCIEAVIVIGKGNCEAWRMKRK